MVPLKGCRGAVLLIRNPADVAVSLSHYFNISLERALACLLYKNAALYDSRTRGSRQVRQFMGSRGNHVCSWLDQSRIPMLPLRYEDLLLQPEEQFGRLARFLELPDATELIAAAVASSRFERLRAREDAEGGFHERPADCERFFRSDRSGEGSEALTPNQLKGLQVAFADILRRCGYPALDQAA